MYKTKSYKNHAIRELVKLIVLPDLCCLLPSPYSTVRELVRLFMREGKGKTTVWEVSRVQTHEEEKPMQVASHCHSPTCLTEKRTDRTSRLQLPQAGFGHSAPAHSCCMAQLTDASLGVRPLTAAMPTRGLRSRSASSCTHASPPLMVLIPLYVTPNP